MGIRKYPVIKYNFFLILIIITLLPQIGKGKDINLSDYFSADNEQTLLDRFSQFRYNPVSNLENDIQEQILKPYPKNLQAYLILVEYHYWITGNLEEARRILYYLEYLLNQVQPFIEQDSEYNKRFQVIRDQTEFIKREMYYNFAPLHFKIMGIDIEKFAVIRGAQIMLQISENVSDQATPEQLKRIDFLKQKYSNNLADIYFTSYDTSSGQIYFTIDDFPLISYSQYKPYAIIVNNMKRYHFDFKDRKASPQEIYWVAEWELVETIPQKEVKLEIIDDRNYTLNKEKIFSSGMNFYTIQREDIVPNYLIKIQNNENVELRLENNFKGQTISKVLLWTYRVALAGGTYMLMNNVKDWK